MKNKLSVFVVFLGILLTAFPVFASQQAYNEYLASQKAYFEAIKSNAPREVISRLAKKLAAAKAAFNVTKTGSLTESAFENKEIPSTVYSQYSESSAPEIAQPASTNHSEKSPGFFEKLWNKADFVFKQLRELFPKLSRLKAFFVQMKLKKEKLENLEQLALKNSHKGWIAGGDLSGVKNAHYTNTRSELEKALRGDYNWFECDVRNEGPLRSLIPFIGGKPRPVTAHDPFQTNGLLFDDWVRIVAKSQRGIKVDLKTDEALDGVIETLKKHKIQDEKLIMNINVTAPKKGPEPENDSRLKKIRENFPKCYIKLSPGSGSIKNGKYTDEAVSRLIGYAKEAGRPVQFALRAEMVTPQTVKILESYGNVSIWNTTWSFNPRNVEQEVKKFRDWGATGIVDIMTTH